MTKLATICLLFASLAATSPIFGQAAGNDNRQAVIIGFRQQPGPGEAAFIRAMGGTVRHTYRLIPAIAARLPQAAVDALRNNPAVTNVDPDLPVYALDEYSSVWGVVRVGAQTVHAGNKGTGIKVCVIDSGIDLDHPDLAANIDLAHSYDFVNDDTSPEDQNGHGTHTAGTIGALLNNGVGVVGVAPEVELLVYKILGANGSGSFSDAIAAVQACKEAGGQVTNNSYGSSVNPGSSVLAAFDAAYNDGVLHVASAGNSGSGTDTVGYPAKYGSVIAVAATDSGNNRASFSSTGPAVELAAPGVGILSTYPDNGYAYLNGTSMASPHVAGVAALVFNCGITPNTAVRARMQQTAQDLGAAGRDNLYGYGLVRAELAALDCGSPPPPPPSPPAAPGGLIASTGVRPVPLAWADNSNNEASFVLERCKVGKNGVCNFAVLATLPVNTSSYLDSSVARRTTYTYQVKARNAGGDSAYSNTATVRTN